MTQNVTKNSIRAWFEYEVSGESIMISSAVDLCLLPRHPATATAEGGREVRKGKHCEQ